MKLLEKMHKDIKRMDKHSSILGIKPESCSTDFNYREIKKLIETAEVLQQLLGCQPTANCAAFSHSKKDQHGCLAACPVEARYEAIINRANALMKKH